MLASLPSAPAAPEAAYADPYEVYGLLFIDVQQAGLFADQKTFVDCQPKRPPAEIVASYLREKANVDLKTFVLENFTLPEEPHFQAFVSETLDHHLETVWPLLQREPRSVPDGSSLLPLAHSYLIPGGRFREIYYWDSYFAMLGLRLSGREELIVAMTDNFADLIRRFGMIPNGNRTYYLTRSHPPLLAAMVEFVAEREGPGCYLRYLPALEGELAYWNDRVHPTRHRVELPDGQQLHRYYDRADFPRPEAFAHDQKLHEKSQQIASDFYRNMRSAAESGWDFSSRWFSDGDGLWATAATDFIPVDLNCFLVQLERTLSRAYETARLPERARALAQAAEERSRAINRFCWSDAQGFYFDYNHRKGRQSAAFTLGGVVPLFVGIASQAQADAVAETLRTKFLQAGGLVTTLVQSGEQWDWPNGWAPLQWMAIAGLRRYGHEILAREIALRWIALNSEVFRRTGRLLEKYNVVDLSLPAGGGEYPTQDGFGWTNGVLVRLKKEYPV